jgi:hypothetical protein
VKAFAEERSHPTKVNLIILATHRSYKLCEDSSAEEIFDAARSNLVLSPVSLSKNYAHGKGDMGESQALAFIYGTLLPKSIYRQFCTIFS